MSARNNASGAIIPSLFAAHDTRVGTLAKELNIPFSHAFGLVVKMLVYCAEWDCQQLERSFDGRPRLLIHASGWDGRPERFVKALIASGFVSPDMTLLESFQPVYGQAAWFRREIARRRLSIMEELTVRDGPGCQNCGDLEADEYHVDHIKPLVRGGNNDAENLQILCRDCNLSKGAKL